MQYKEVHRGNDDEVFLVCRVRELGIKKKEKKSRMPILNERRRCERSIGHPSPQPPLPPPHTRERRQKTAEALRRCRPIKTRIRRVPRYCSEFIVVVQLDNL